MGGGVAYGTVSGGSVTYTAGDATATFSAATDTANPGAPAITYGAPPAIDAAMPGGVQISYGAGGVYSGGEPQGIVYETNLQAEAPMQTTYVQGDVPAQTMFVQGEASMQMQPPEIAAQTITYGAPQYEVPGQTLEMGGQAYAVQGQNITYGISGQMEVGQGQTITYGAPSAQFEVQPAEGGVGGSGFVTYSAPPQPEMQGQVTYTSPEMPQGQVTYTTPEIQGQVTYTTPQSVVGGHIGFGGPTIQQGQIGGPQQGSVTIGGTVGYGGQPIQGQIGVPQPTMQGQEFTSNMTVGIQGQIGGNYQGQIVGGMPGQVVQGIPQATYTMGSGAVTQGLSYQIPGQVGYAANSGYQMAGQAICVWRSGLHTIFDHDANWCRGIIYAAWSKHAGAGTNFVVIHTTCELHLWGSISRHHLWGTSTSSGSRGDTRDCHGSASAATERRTVGCRVHVVLHQRTTGPAN